MTNEKNNSPTKQVSPEIPSEDEDIQIIDDDEVEDIGELDNELDDPEGWMAENASYWLDLPDPQPLTRQAWVRHKIKELVELLWSLTNPTANPWQGDRIPESEWIRLYESLFFRFAPMASDCHHEIKHASDCKRKTLSVLTETSSKSEVSRKRLGGIVIRSIATKAI